MALTRPHAEVKARRASFLRADHGGANRTHVLCDRGDEPFQSLPLAKTRIYPWSLGGEAVR